MAKKKGGNGNGTVQFLAEVLTEVDPNEEKIVAMFVYRGRLYVATDKRVIVFTGQALRAGR